MIKFAERGDAGVILWFLTSKLRSCCYRMNQVEVGRNTLLHEKPRITRPLSRCPLRSEGEWCSACLVLVVEALKTCLIANVSTLLVPGAEDVVNLYTGGESAKE